MIQAIGLVGMAVGFAWLGGATTSAAADSATQNSSRGAELFEAQCSSCHGVDGRGIDGRAPTLHDEGEAAVDFVLRTGRMPLANPGNEPTRGRVRLSDKDIEALVSYVGTFGGGPAIPDVDPRRGDLAEGGNLFRLNCAACHVASGAGANIGGDRVAPSLMESTPTQVGEAVRVGPGAMPVFGDLTPRKVDSIAAYISHLQSEGTTDVDSLGGIGPVAEGLVAWLVPLAALIALTRWIGKPHRTSDPAQPDTGTNL